LTLGWVGVGWAQMEKRIDSLYEAAVFERAYPAVGYRAPSLQLTDLEGRSVSLLDFRGKHVVLVKAGYT
jgi:hypothetical protein